MKVKIARTLNYVAQAESDEVDLPDVRDGTPLKALEERLCGMLERNEISFTEPGTPEYDCSSYEVLTINDHGHLLYFED